MGFNGKYRKNVVEEVKTTSSINWFGVPFTTNVITEYSVLNGFTGYTNTGNFFEYFGINEIDLALMTDSQYENRVNDLLSTISNLNENEKEILTNNSSGTDIITCPITPTTTTTTTIASTTTTTTSQTTTTTTTAGSTTTTTVAPLNLNWNIQRNGSSGSNLKIYLNGTLMINKSATTTLQSGSFIIESGDDLLIRNTWTSGNENISRCRVCNDFNGNEIDYTEADIDTPIIDTLYSVVSTSVKVSLRGGGLTPPACTI